jgi:hypothetical protein
MERRWSEKLVIAASYHAAGDNSNGAATSQRNCKVLFFSVRITLTRDAIAIAGLSSRPPCSKDAGVSSNSGTKTQC